MREALMPYIKKFDRPGIDDAINTLIRFVTN
jgi:hypothetical protein